MQKKFCAGLVNLQNSFIKEIRDTVDLEKNFFNLWILQVIAETNATQHINLIVHVS